MASKLHLYTTLTATIGGDQQNSIQFGANYSTIPGGVGNIIQQNSTYSSIGGGFGNTVISETSYSTIAGDPRQADRLQDQPSERENSANRQRRSMGRREG